VKGRCAGLARRHAAYGLRRDSCVPDNSVERPVRRSRSPAQEGSTPLCSCLCLCRGIYVAAAFRPAAFAFAFAVAVAVAVAVAFFGVRRLDAAFRRGGSPPLPYVARRSRAPAGNPGPLLLLGESAGIYPSEKKDWRTAPTSCAVFWRKLLLLPFLECGGSTPLCHVPARRDALRRAAHPRNNKSSAANGLPCFLGGRSFSSHKRNRRAARTACAEFLRK